MALHRRFLISFESENSSVCTHDCYAFPFPPPPLPSPLSSGDSFSGRHLIVNIIIAIVSFASAILFLVLTYYTVLMRRRRGEGVLPAGGNGGTTDLDDGDANYPVWHIRTVGLDESAINSISAKPYVTGDGNASDCSVCLGDFSEGELVRFLPACGHAFHVLCIDTWLRAHIICPLCRTKIFDVASEEGEFSSVARVLEVLEEDEGVDVTHTVLDCIESYTFPDQGDLPENVSGQEFLSNSMSDSMGSFMASDLSFRMDRREISKDMGILCREKQGSSFSVERTKKSLDFGGGSTSDSGRIFFFSRYGRSRSSSVLPM